MKNNQYKYMEYAKKFTSSNKTHIWLGGSFLHGGATAYSDVDMSVYCNAETLKKLIYGYGQPIYVSYTKNPLGILIVIYEDGVALDLEIVEKVEVTGNEYFHRLDIKENNYVRNDTVCKEFVFDDDTASMSFTLEKIIPLNANYVQSTSQLKKLCKFLFQNSI